MGDKRRSLAAIDAWRSRGRIPVAVEATYNLVGIMLRDPYFQEPCDDRCSDEELRCLYAMHIIRAVNATVDLAQKGAYAMSVEGLAKSLGIPAWIVELRHEATHAPRLPALSSLRMAAEQLLAYCFAKYWQAQVDMLVDSSVDQAMSSDKVWQTLDGLNDEQSRPIDSGVLAKLCRCVTDESVVISWVLKKFDNSDRFEQLVNSLISRLSESFLTRLFNAAVFNPVMLEIVAKASSPRIISALAVDCISRQPGNDELFRTLKPYFNNFQTTKP